MDTSDESAEFLPFRLDNLNEARESAITLQRKKALARATKAPDFEGKIERLLAQALRDGDESTLQCIALMFRIAAVANPIRPTMGRLVGTMLREPALLPQQLPDSDDRRYFGEGLQHAVGEWVVGYTARASVEETAGEDAREQFLRALLRSTNDLTQAVNALRLAFSSWKVETQDIGASRARRLTRVLIAFRKVLVDIDPEPGDSLGASYGDLVRAAIGGEPILDAEAREQAAIATLDLLSAVVRFHFSISSDVETYSVTSAIRRWFPSQRLPGSVEPLMRVVARQLAEALVFLAKQGIAHEQLRRTLMSMVGDARGSAAFREMVTEVKGVPDELRRWLLTGKREAPKLATSAAVDESVLRTLDMDLAFLLRDSKDLKAGLDILEDDLPAAVASYEPRLVPVAERLLLTSRRIAARIDAIATKRQMRFEGQPGEVTEFNPVDHEEPSAPLRTLKVRIREPGVIRMGGNGPATTILRATVEGDEQS